MSEHSQTGGKHRRVLECSFCHLRQGQRRARRPGTDDPETVTIILDQDTQRLCCDVCAADIAIAGDPIMDYVEYDIPKGEVGPYTRFLAQRSTRLGGPRER